MVSERSLIKSEVKENAEDDGEATKEQLQHEMEEARESISQTVSDIGNAVSSQAKVIRETISKKLDWREHARQHPGAIGIGALTVGFIVGYSVIGAINKRSFNGASRSYNQDDYQLSDNATSTKRALQKKAKSSGPDWIEKLTSTRAFNKLRNETSGLMDHFVDEAVNIGKTVLVPAAINKISQTINSTLDLPDNQTTNTHNADQKNKA